MARYTFTPGRPYAGRLLQVSTRPLENDPNTKIALIRLEFEIYSRSDDERTLCSLGKIACRDLVIGPQIPAAKDSGIMVYANALGLTKRVDSVDSWTGILPGSVWIEIVFGELDPVDYRNPFVKVSRFSPTGWKSKEFDYEIDKIWVTPEVAADDLECSTSKVRRTTKTLYGEWGNKLERRTHGNHRRINLPLLRMLVHNVK